MEIIKRKNIKGFSNSCGVIQEMLGVEDIGIAYVQVVDNFTPHFHKKMKEVYFVVKGEGIVTINNEEYEIEKDDLIFIDTNELHSVKNISNQEQLELVVITNSKYDKEDVYENSEIDIEEKNIAFIDGQNLYYNTATDNNNPWKVDLNKFRIFLKDKYYIENAYYFLGVENEKYNSLYKNIKKAGFELLFRSHKTEMTGEKKGNIDVDLIFTVMKKFSKNEIRGKVILVAGDGDYYKLVKFLIENNKFKKILFPNKKSASSLYNEFTLKYFDNLSRKENREKIEYKIV